MLHELRIRNFAIIDELHLVFGSGLNILTGETGAGKSIIIDAIGLLLGDRAATEWVRAGAEMASIEATFALPQQAESDAAADLRQLLAGEGLDDPDAPDWLLLGREVRLSGRNVCRVNGRAVSLQILADVASALIDIHGQGEHLNLLRPKTHVHLLDRYANLLPQRKQVANEVATLRAVRAELQRLRQDARTIAQRIDLLSFQVDEISSARLTPGEEGELESERRRLANAEALLKLAQAAEAILSRGDGDIPGALDQVSEAVGRMEKLARIDPDMQATADEGQALLEQLTDLARTLEDYAENLEFNPERLQEVEERLELIAMLKRKYGDTIEQINAFGQRAQRELDELGNWEVKTADLEKREDALLRQIGRLSAELSSKRKQAGERLSRAVEGELADLKMSRARFGVAVEQVERADGAILPDGRRVAFESTGIDHVEFLISANPGEPLKPMAKVASGGETARLMLALKGVLTHADATPHADLRRDRPGHRRARWLDRRSKAVDADRRALCTGKRRGQTPGVVHHPSAAARCVWRPALYGRQACADRRRRRAHQHRRAYAGGRQPRAGIDSDVGHPQCRRSPLGGGDAGGSGRGQAGTFGQIGVRRSIILLPRSLHPDGACCRF
jgi:DNA repair protein RecN (Recombination protein N)